MATIVGHQEVCPGCAGDIDPENHVRNVKTDTVYCSMECFEYA